MAAREGGMLVYIRSRKCHSGDSLSLAFHEGVGVVDNEVGIVLRSPHQRIRVTQQLRARSFVVASRRVVDVESVTTASVLSRESIIDC